MIAGTFVLDNYFYGYMSAFVILTLVGVVVQHKRGYHLSDGFSKVY